LKEVFKIENRAYSGQIKGSSFFNRHVKSLVDLFYFILRKTKRDLQLLSARIEQRKHECLNTLLLIILDILDRLVQNYNNTIHSSMKMTPVQASEKKNENRVDNNLFPMMLIDKPSNISTRSGIR